MLRFICMPASGLPLAPSLRGKPKQEPTDLGLWGGQGSLHTRASQGAWGWQPVACVPLEPEKGCCPCLFVMGRFPVQGKWMSAGQLWACPLCLPGYRGLGGPAWLPVSRGTGGSGCRRAGLSMFRETGGFASSRGGQGRESWCPYWA